MRLRNLLGAAVSGLVLLVPFAAAAQAYSPDPTSRTQFFDTSECPCWEYDPADDTYFAHDSGGEAVKIELWDDGDMVGKVEFHPYGEKLWVYDTKNDGDSIYVDMYFRQGGRNYVARVQPPQTGNRLDYAVWDQMNISDGNSVSVWVYDDASRQDLITGGSSSAA